VRTPAVLATMGIGRRAIDRLKRSGRLRSAGQGVVASTSSPVTVAHRMSVACGASGGVVTLRPAGLVWGFRKTPRSGDVHVVTPDSRYIDPLPGVVIHR